MRNYYKNQKNEVIALLKKSSLWERVSIYEEDAGLHFLLRIRTDKSDRAIKEDLDKCGIHIRSMADYTHGRKKIQEHTFVINYTALDTEALPEVLEEISRNVL